MMENNKKPTPVEWFYQQINGMFYIHESILEEAKELEEARITLAVRLGAGSIGKWTPELEEAILKEFKK